MSRDPLVLAFESASLAASEFHHRQHLYVAWCYLGEMSAEDALARYVGGLKLLTQKLGVPEKFHATITWAYVALLDDAMQRSPGVSFDELLERNPGLLDHKSGDLRRYYSQAELDAPEARLRFVLPRPRIG
ncbi:MAG: hypothetical protein AB7K71_39615 [Polyangiaceae bacterium]